MGELEVVSIDTEVVAKALMERIEQASPEAKASTKEEVLCNGRYDLYSLLKMYKLVEGMYPKSEHERWMAVFSAGASTGGVWAVKVAGEFKALAVYWKTKNPHVNLEKEVPRPSSDGNHAYVAFMWSVGDYAKRVIRHIRATLPTVEFLSWHDQRKKRGKKRFGQLWVMELPEPEAPFARMTNGAATHG